MIRVFHSKKARIDLLEIWAYIAEENQSAADKLLDAIDEKCILLGRNPKMGQGRPDISLEMRYFPVKNYLILYREQEFGIEVVRIVHGMRDIGEIEI